MTTRTEFMARIRAEVGKTRGLPPATPARRPERPRVEAEAIRAELAERWPEALERFRHELDKVGGVFYRVATLAEVVPVVAGIARERAARRLVSWHAAELGGDLGPALTAQGLQPVALPAGGGVGTAPGPLPGRPRASARARPTGRGPRASQPWCRRPSSSDPC